MVHQVKDCLFCKMAKGSLPVNKVYEDEDFFCIRDIEPQAKTHLLVMPKKHVVSLVDVFSSNSGESEKLVGRLFSVATEVAKKEGLLPGGFRSVINTDRNAGQTVFHLHLHILGGEPLKGGFGT